MKTTFVRMRKNAPPGQSLIDAALAAGTLNPEEAHNLKQTEAAWRMVITVDGFAKEELTLGAGKVRKQQCKGGFYDGRQLQALATGQRPT